MVSLVSSVVRVRVKGFLAGLFVAALTVSMLPYDAGAFSNTGPSPGVQSGSTTPNYVLVKSPNTGDMSIMNIPLYSFTSVTSDVVLTVADARCGADYVVCEEWVTSRDQFVEIRWGSTVLGRTNGGTVTIPRAAFVYDAATNTYKANLTMILRNRNNGAEARNEFRNRIGFRLESRTGIYIGNSSGGSSSYVNIISNNPNQGGPHAYKILFGTPCDIATGTRGTIEFYDLDAGHVDNGYHHVSITVTKVGGGVVATEGSGDPGNGTRYYVGMTFNPGERYEMTITNIASINMVQYKFPYDNINYTQTCSNWSVSAVSQLKIGATGSWVNRPSTNPLTVQPEQTVYFRHTITNNGPTKTDSPIRGVTRNEEGGKAGSGVMALPGLSVPDFLANGAAAGVSSTRGTASLLIGQAHVSDERINCQLITASPGGSSVSSRSSSRTCFKVPYSYTLMPNIAINRTTVESAGTEIGVTPNVTNTGHTKSNQTDWQITYITVPSGVNIPTGTGSNNSNLAPCQYYGTANGKTCVAATFVPYSGGLHSNNGTTDFGVGTHQFTQRRAITEGVDPGTRVCYALSINSYTNADTSSPWRHSNLACAVVAKRPVAQVLGGDLIVGRASPVSASLLVRTNVKTVGGTQYGSWAEYGIISSGRVQGMASAAGYAGGVDSSKSFCNASFLTFANRPAGSTTCGTNTNIGGYAMSGASVDSAIAARFPVASATNFASSHLAIGPETEPGIYTTTHTDEEIGLSITSQPHIGKGKWYVLNVPTKTVRITTNINYTNEALLSISEIPQVIIIARNITIDESVTNIDAWLVAIPSENSAGHFGGYINTCQPITANDPRALTGQRCTAPLRINGPVVANRIFLYRTAGSGSGTAAGDPAEVFNLRPDAYLWGTAMQQGTIKARTTVTTELPPRY